MNSNCRSGGVLICVLVVLLIVGMITAQTIQTLLMVRRSDSARSRLRQAQELVELGRMVVQQQGQEELPEQVVALDDTLQGVILIRSEDNGLEDRDSETKILRIQVKYPVNSAQEVTVTGSVTVNTKGKP